MNLNLDPNYLKWKNLATKLLEDKLLHRKHGSPFYKYFYSAQTAE